jgi:hypothetical protein
MKTKQKRKLRKLLKLGKNPIKIRIPIAPPSKKFKSIKDYNRKKDKILLKKSLRGGLSD